MFWPLLGVKVSFCVAGERFAAPCQKCTQVIDRCWRFLKDRLSLNQKTKARSNLLRAKLRSAQYQYWYKNADMWVATGSLCQWASKRFMGKKWTAKLWGKMYCNVLLRIFIVHSRAESFFLIQFMPGLLHGLCLDWCLVVPRPKWVSKALHMRYGSATHGLMHAKQCIVCPFPPTQVLSMFMHLCGQFLHMCYAAATYANKMCPGACRAHAPKILSWCSATIGEKIRRKTRHSRTYLIHKM